MDKDNKKRYIYSDFVSSNKRSKIIDLSHINNDEKEYIKIDKEIKTLQDLIDLGNMYDESKRYDIDLKLLNNKGQRLNEKEGDIWKDMFL